MTNIFKISVTVNGLYRVIIVRSDSYQDIGTFNTKRISTDIKIDKGEAIFIVIENVFLE